jgi:hypothetical protein
MPILFVYATVRPDDTISKTAWAVSPLMLSMDFGIVGPGYIK